MDSLPAELLNLILLWDIRMCRCEKNSILPLRLVCKAFDEILKPYVFKTIQLEFSRFLRQRRGAIEAKDWDEEGKIARDLQGHGSGLDVVWGHEAIWKLTMDREGLKRVGGCCEALYLDLMVVRDEGRLSSFFQRFWVVFVFFCIVPITRKFVWVSMASANWARRGNNSSYERLPGPDTQGSGVSTTARLPSEILYE
jgi:hypothetical protein